MDAGKMFEAWWIATGLHEEVISPRVRQIAKKAYLSGARACKVAIQDEIHEIGFLENQTAKEIMNEVREKLKAFAFEFETKQEW